MLHSRCDKDIGAFPSHDIPQPSELGQIGLVFGPDEGVVILFRPAPFAIRVDIATVLNVPCWKVHLASFECLLRVVSIQFL